jgi:hypothetical protein
MAYLRCFKGFIYFLFVGKVIDFGCVLRRRRKLDELKSPLKMSFALRVQLFSKISVVDGHILG